MRIRQKPRWMAMVMRKVLQEAEAGLGRLARLAVVAAMIRSNVKSHYACVICRSSFSV